MTGRMSSANLARTLCLIITRGAIGTVHALDQKTTSYLERAADHKPYRIARLTAFSRHASVVRCPSVSIGECVLSQKSQYAHDEDKDPRPVAPCRELDFRRDA